MNMQPQTMYLGSDGVSNKVELHYNPQNGGWFAIAGGFQTKYHATQRSAAMAGNDLARVVCDPKNGPTQFLNVEQYIG